MWIVLSTGGTAVKYGILYYIYWLHIMLLMKSIPARQVYNCLYRYINETEGVWNHLFCYNKEALTLIVVQMALAMHCHECHAHTHTKWHSHINTFIINISYITIETDIMNNHNNSDQTSTYLAASFSSSSFADVTLSPFLLVSQSPGWLVSFGVTLASLLSVTPVPLLSFLLSPLELEWQSDMLRCGDGGVGFDNIWSLLTAAACCRCSSNCCRFLCCWRNTDALFTVCRPLLLPPLGAGLHADGFRAPSSQA